jgi:hypothetical protein
MRYFVFNSSRSEQFSIRKESWKIGKWTRGILQHDFYALLCLCQGLPEAFSDGVFAILITI